MSRLPKREMTRRLLRWCNEHWKELDPEMLDLEALAVDATAELQFIVPVPAMRMALEVVTVAMWMRCVMRETPADV